MLTRRIIGRQNALIVAICVTLLLAKHESLA
jgi:hypothetical protein